MLKKFMDAGIRFDYCEYAVYPQIPCIQDVLYALQFSDRKDDRGYYCPEGAANWGEYISNLMLASAAVADELLTGRYDEAEAKKLIAETILELCPDEAKCLFNGEYVDAKKLVDANTSDVTKMSRDERLAACGCASCNKRAEHELLNSPGMR